MHFEVKKCRNIFLLRPFACRYGGHMMLKVRIAPDWCATWACLRFLMEKLPIVLCRHAVLCLHLRCPQKLAPISSSCQCPQCWLLDSSQLWPFLADQRVFEPVAPASAFADPAIADLFFRTTRCLRVDQSGCYNDPTDPLYAITHSGLDAQVIPQHMTACFFV